MLLSLHRTRRASQVRSQRKSMGPITAMAIETFAPPMEVSKRRRDFATWLGLVPRQHSTGGGKEVCAFLRRELGEQGADPVPKTVDGSFGCLSQQRLEFREGVFDRIEAGGRMPFFIDTFNASRRPVQALEHARLPKPRPEQ